MRFLKGTLEELGGFTIESPHVGQVVRIPLAIAGKERITCEQVVRVRTPAEFIQFRHFFPERCAEEFVWMAHGGRT